MAESWDYFDKFEETIDKYMPPVGEGTTFASQAVTAVNKLIYKWYNDGDVFDNTYHLEGWFNDLSTYANWLDWHVRESSIILGTIKDCINESDYEDLLRELANAVLNEDILRELDKIPASGSIYECTGRFEFKEE